MFENFDSDIPNPDHAVYLETPEFGQYLQIFISKSSQSYQISIGGSPGEKGMMNFDNRVRLPTIVSIDGWVTDVSASTLKSIRSTQRAKNLDEALCKFYGLGGECVENLAIETLVVSEDSNYLNLLHVSIRLKEFILTEK